MAVTDGPVFTQLQTHLGAQAITGDLLQVCNDTIDQLLEEETESSRPGMLLGKIQSGKTKRLSACSPWRSIMVLTTPSSSPKGDSSSASVAGKAFWC